MARTERRINASPERIFDVLSQAGAYGDWVVGSKVIRDVDAGFPAKGSRFHHTVGTGPFTVSDHTEVLEVDPPALLKLKAKARPLGTAIVTLEIEPDGNGGSNVTMIEDAGDPLTAFVFNPLTHLLVRGRNEKSLERLDRICVEGRSAERESS